MASIGQRAFVLGGNKKYLSLGFEELQRPFSSIIYNNWTTLRLGFHWAVNNQWGNYNIANQPVFAAGICSGTAGVGSATTTNFIGQVHTGGQVLTCTANSGNPYYASGYFYSYRKSGVIATLVGAGTTVVNIAGTNSALQKRSVSYTDITKLNTTQYTVINYYNATNQFTFDTDFNGFLEGLEIVGTPSIRGNALAAANLQTIACDQTPGVFDTVNVQWGSFAFPLEIYALAVYRIS